MVGYVNIVLIPSVLLQVEKENKALVNYVTVQDYWVDRSKCLEEEEVILDH